MNIKDHIINNKMLLVGSVLVLALAATPLYGVGYFILAAAVALRLNVLKSFSSTFANFVIALLIIFASIMVSGIFTSFLEIPNAPIINLLFMFLFCGSILYFQQEKPVRKRHFDTSDGISIVIASILPIIIIALQFLSNPIDIALFKLVNADGWDNTSHLNLLQGVSDNSNYFYSTSPAHTDGKAVFNNYPQGWHLAMASVVDGLVPGVFHQDSYSLRARLLAYVIISLTWLALATYVFSKVMWSLLPRLKDEGARSLRRYVIFPIIALLPVLALYISTIAAGYVNYLALIPYVILIVAASYQLLQANNRRDVLSYYSFALILVAGVCLMWVLPTPPLVILVASVAFMGGLQLKDILRSPVAMVVTSIVAASLVGYLYILTRDISLDHIGVGSTWLEHFPTTFSVFVCLAIVATYFIVKKASYDNLVVLFAPFLVYIFAVWMLTFISGDRLGYYHAKILGIFFVVAALFTGSFLVQFVESIKTAQFSKYVSLAVVAMISVSALSSILVLSDIKIDGRTLRRHQYYLDHKELAFINDWMSSKDSTEDDGQLLLMRDNILDNRNKAMLFNRVAGDSAKRFLASSSPSAAQNVREEYTCILNIYYETDEGVMRVIKDRAVVLGNLSHCLEIRNDAGLPTTVRLPNSLKEIISNIDTHGAQLVYYAKN